MHDQQVIYIPPIFLFVSMFLIVAGNSTLFFDVWGLKIRVKIFSNQYTSFKEYISEKTITPWFFHPLIHILLILFLIFHTQTLKLI